MKDLSNFHKVALINRLAGNPSNDDWGGLQRQQQVIDGEYKELAEGVDLENLTEMVDGALDTLVTVYGMLFRAGVDADAGMAEVCDSLLTRFDATADDAVKTKAKYLAIGIDTETRETQVDGVTYYVTISAADQVCTAKGERFPKGKFLKSYKFRQPDMEKIILPEVWQRLGKKSQMT